MELKKLYERWDFLSVIASVTKHIVVGHLDNEDQLKKIDPSGGFFHEQTSRF